MPKWDHKKLKIYLEDDISFTKENFNYWLQNKDIVMSVSYLKRFFKQKKDKRTSLNVKIIS
ncbi:MAG: hypothetical protein DRI95_05740 [Bacteroidetes bacterium]|nr:MAG: hypothetical protein DRI95_05740 [Bacteroidota bacterium]